MRFLSCTHMGQIAIVNLVLQETLPHCFADSFLKFNRSFDFLGHGHCPLRDQAGMQKNTMFRTEREALSGHLIFLQQNQCRNCWVKALALGTFLRLIVNTFLPWRSWQSFCETLRLENLESFPGPFGRVDQSTTEAVKKRFIKRLMLQTSGEHRYGGIPFFTGFYIHLSYTT